MRELLTILDEVANGAPARELALRFASGGPAATEALRAHHEAGWAGPVSAETFLRMVASAGGIGVLAPLTALGGDLDLRVAAIQALGHSRHPDALAPLVSVLNGRRRWTDGAMALGHHAGGGTLTALREAWAVRVGSADPIREGIPLDFHGARELKGRIALAGALARVGSREGERMLVTLSRLQHDTERGHAWTVRLEAVRALAFCPGAPATRALIEALDDLEDEVSELAATTLAAFGTTSCISHLVRRFRGEDQVDDAIARAIAELVGEDALPETASTPMELRRWWMRWSTRTSPERATWLGEPADPGVAVELLTESERGGLARAALELWTGIDFVDEATPGVRGDDVDQARARAWWARHEAGWAQGALYRGGRPEELASIVAALVHRRR